MATEAKKRSVQVFGRKKNSTAVAYITDGKGAIRVNGVPLKLLEPEVLRYKVFEPVLLLGKDVFNGVDVRIRVRGGGYVSQIYAIRQAIAKGIISWTQKFVDEATKAQLRATLVEYDRSLLVADPRRAEPKKYGGTGARSRYQKSLGFRPKVALLPKLGYSSWLMDGPGPGPGSSANGEAKPQMMSVFNPLTGAMVQVPAPLPGPGPAPGAPTNPNALESKLGQLDKLVDDIVEGVASTKQHFQLEAAEAERTVAASTLHKIDTLRRMEQQYAALVPPLAVMVETFKAYAEQQRALGERLYDLALKEEQTLPPALVQLLREMGEYLRDVEREGGAVAFALGICLDQMSTFHRHAIADSLETLTRLTAKQRVLEEEKARLRALGGASSPDGAAIGAQQAKVTQLREGVEAAAFDFETKVSLLNDKRLTELARQLERALLSLERFVRKLNELIAHYTIKASSDHEGFLERALSTK